MRGKNSYKLNPVKPDAKYGNLMLAKFINKIMLHGKKETATNIVYRTLEIIKTKMEGVDPILVFETAVKNASPALEVRSKRIGGATYQVPTEIRPERKVALAIRWIINSARNRQGKAMQEFLASELIDAYQETGAAIKKKEEMHKMAEANRAFAHFARF